MNRHTLQRPGKDQRGGSEPSSALGPQPMSVCLSHTHARTRSLSRSLGGARPLTCWSAAAERGGGGDGRGHGGSKASTAVTWRSGHIPARHGAGQGQRELRLDLLLQGLLLTAGSICHESEKTAQVSNRGHLQSRRTYGSHLSLRDAAPHPCPWGKGLLTGLPVSKLTIESLPCVMKPSRLLFDGCPKPGRPLPTANAPCGDTDAAQAATRRDSRPSCKCPDHPGAQSISSTCGLAVFTVHTTPPPVDITASRQL